MPSAGKRSAKGKVLSSSSYRQAVNDFWQKSKPLSQSLPVRLPNGSSVIKLVAACSGCNHSVPQNMLRGDVKPSLLGYRVTAFGRCDDCNLLTPFMCEAVQQDKTWRLVTRKWKGWKDGEVVFVDFTKKK